MVQTKNFIAELTDYDLELSYLSYDIGINLGHTVIYLGLLFDIKCKDPFKDVVLYYYGDCEYKLPKESEVVIVDDPADAGIVQLRQFTCELSYWKVDDSGILAWDTITKEEFEKAVEAACKAHNIEFDKEELEELNKRVFKEAQYDIARLIDQYVEDCQ